MLFLQKVQHKERTGTVVAKGECIGKQKHGHHNLMKEELGKRDWVVEKQSE
jgi:hypothetical protein